MNWKRVEEWVDCLIETTVESVMTGMVWIGALWGLVTLVHYFWRHT